MNSAALPLWASIPATLLLILGGLLTVIGSLGLLRLELLRTHARAFQGTRWAPAVCLIASMITSSAARSSGDARDHHYPVHRHQFARDRDAVDARLSSPQCFQTQGRAQRLDSGITPAPAPAQGAAVSRGPSPVCVVRTPAESPHSRQDLPACAADYRDNSSAQIQSASPALHSADPTIWMRLLSSRGPAAPVCAPGIGHLQDSHLAIP